MVKKILKFQLFISNITYIAMIVVFIIGMCLEIKGGIEEMKPRVSMNEYYGKNELICPFCGKKQLNHEPDEITAYLCVTTCEHCERIIEYSVEVSRTYYPDIPDDEEGKEEGRETKKIY